MHGTNIKIREYDIFNRLWPNIVQIIRTQFLPHTRYCAFQFKNKLFNSLKGNDCAYFEIYTVYSILGQEASFLNIQESGKWINILMG